MRCQGNVEARMPNAERRTKVEARTPLFVIRFSVFIQISPLDIRLIYHFHP